MNNNAAYKKTYKYIIIILTTVIYLNILFVAFFTDSLYKRAINLSRTLNKVKDQTIIVYTESDYLFGRTYRYMLKELNINYLESSEPLNDPLYNFNFQFTINK